jgi:hypothetical protein
MDILQQEYSSAILSGGISPRAQHLYAPACVCLSTKERKYVMVERDSYKDRGLDQIEGLTKEDCLEYFARKENKQRKHVKKSYSGAKVRQAAALYLNTLERGLTIETVDLAKAIAPDVEDPKALSSICGKLTRFAPGTTLATHDGEKFTYMGKPARRWRWHGQA